MAVDDLWHLTRSPAEAKPCGEHGNLVASDRHGRGKRYRVRYTDPSGAPRSRLFEKKGDAERFDLKTRSDVARGEYVDPREGKLTFREVGELWRPNQAHGEKTTAEVERYFRLHVYPYLGDAQVAAVKPSDIQGLIRHLGPRLAPSTIAVVMAYVSSVFNAAVEDGRVPRNPCRSKSVRLPTVERTRVKPLPLDVVNGLRAEAPAWSRVLHDLAALAGLRQGEAFGLEVEHVDFLRRELRVEQQLQTLNGQKPFLKAPKTPKSLRTIPIGTALVERLAAHLAQFPPREIPIVDKTGVRPIVRLARLIVLSPGGVPVRTSRYDERVWRPAVKAFRARRWAAENGMACHADAAVPAEVLAKYEAAMAGVDVGKVDFHELRHFFASALIRRGLSVRAVAERLGHKNTTVTINVYGHLWPDDDDRTRDAMDTIVGVQDRLRVVP